MYTVARDNDDLELNAAAEKISLLCRSWSSSIFLSALNSSRSDQQKEAIVKEIYVRLQRVLPSTLGVNLYDLSTVILHFEKSVQI